MDDFVLLISGYLYIIKQNDNYKITDKIKKLYGHNSEK